MSEHINNVCNLSTIDGEQVKFITTDNYGLTQTLSDTGDIIVYRDGDRHDIYIAGEHIAGGYGFDNDSNIDRLTSISSYYSSLSYVNSNIDILEKVIGEYNEEHNGVEPSDDVKNSNTSFVIGNTTYTLVNDGGQLVFDKQCETTLSNVMFVIDDSTKENIISVSPLIVKGGTDLKFKRIMFDIEGTYDIEKLDIYSYAFYSKLKSQSAGAKIYQKEFTDFEINTDLFQTSYIIQDENYHHTETDGSDVSELTLNHIGNTNDNSDAILIAMKDELMSTPGYPKEYVSETIYWHLPYITSTEEITMFNINDLDKQYSNNIMLTDNCNVEFTISFIGGHDKKAPAYIACPLQWGDFKFIHKDSGLTQKWERITTNPLSVTIGTSKILYHVYKTNVEYYNSDITWIIK